MTAPKHHKALTGLLLADSLLADVQLRYANPSARNLGQDYNTWQQTAPRRLCGEEHHTDRCLCRNEDPQKHYCVNCKVHGHGASDKLCGTYIRLLVKMNKRDPGALFK